MNPIFRYISVASRPVVRTPSVAARRETLAEKACNYDNDYYGDRCCRFEVEGSNASPKR